MIKISSQGKSILLLSDRKQHKDCQNCILADVGSASELKLAYEELILKNKLSSISFYHPDENELWKWFSSMFRIISAAGGLVMNENKELLFIKRHGKWDLPKGKIEKNESAEAAALREVEEECGISGLRLEKKLLTTYHTYFLEEQPVLKPTHWYLMSAERNDKLVPQLEEGITEVKWVKENELDPVRENTYDSILDVMNSFTSRHHPE